MSLRYCEHRDVQGCELTVDEALHVFSNGNEPESVIGALSNHRINEMLRLFLLEDETVDDLPVTILDALLREKIARLMGNCNRGQKEAIAQTMTPLEVEMAIGTFGLQHFYMQQLRKLRGEAVVGDAVAA